MTETPTAAELAIDAVATDRADAAYDAATGGKAACIDAALAAAAPRVVAAELRRIADRHQPVPVVADTYEEAAEAYATEKICGILRARADELDPPARQED